MKLLFATAFAILVSVFVISVADAADLHYGYNGKPDYSPYADPRYGQIYGDPRYRAPEPSYHAPKRYAGKHYPDHSYKDGPVFQEPRRYSVRPYRYERYDYRCTPRHIVRRRLARQGWCDFSLIRMRPHVAVVNARRDGVSYRLRIDRCTGEILRARALKRHHRHYRGFRRFGVTWQPGYRHAY